MTGPGTIAVMISFGLSRSAYSDNGQDLQFCKSARHDGYSVGDTFALLIPVGVERVLGNAGTDIVVRLTAFILFCLGVQFVWTGASELLGTITSQKSAMLMIPVLNS